MVLTENMAINVIYHRIRSSVLAAAPRYTPPTWWECDVYAVSKALFTTEYEVKLSRADFLADAKKRRRKYERVGGVWSDRHEQKHQSVQDGEGTNRFYYVVPLGLLSLDDIPSWAGLIELTNRCGRNGWVYWHPGVVKRAPSLHRTKVTLDVVQQMHMVLAHRFWWMRMFKKGAVT